MMRIREASGFATQTYRYTIPHFIDYCIDRNQIDCVITKDLVDGWLDKKDYRHNSRAIFISLLREFTKYLHFIGRTDYIPDESYSTKRIRFNPYLFTDEELDKLFFGIDNYKAKTCGSNFLPELVLPVYSRLLYCCGMRPQEPPSLLCEDIDLDTGSIYIRESKKNKDRHIIMSESMRLLCKKYDFYAGKRVLFFERWDGKPYSVDWYTSKFSRILQETEVSWRGKPRPYDLRHAFASRNIIKWMEAGKDIMELMPYLSAYMGHSELDSTLYYIHLLPEKLRNTTKIAWDKFQSIYD